MGKGKRARCSKSSGQNSRPTSGQNGQRTKKRKVAAHTPSTGGSQDEKEAPHNLGPLHSQTNARLQELESQDESDSRAVSCEQNGEMMLVPPM